MTEKRFKLSEYLNRIETDDKVFTLFGPKQLVTNEVFVVSAMKAMTHVSDGEHQFNGVKVQVASK